MNTENTPQTVVEAVERWTEVAREMNTDNIWEHFTCTEVEATADLARAIGRVDVAEMIVELHAAYDEPGDEHYKPEAAAGD